MTSEKFTIDESRRAFCNRCQGMTSHGSLFRRRRMSENDEELGWEELNEMLQCHGCDSVTFRVSHALEGDYIEVESGAEQAVSVQDYPPRVSRPAPLWLMSLDWEIQTILREVYAALHSNLRNLAAMGARAVIDRIMADKVGEKGTFVGRLQLMIAHNLITSDQGQILDAALDLGNAANHRGHRVSQNELGTAMDIIEHLLQTLYVLPDQAARLRKRIPPRV